MKKIYLPISLTVLSICFLLSSANAKEEINFPRLTCQETLAQTGICPSQECYWACLIPNEPIDTCAKSCFPKPCVQILAEHCPLDRCQILEGCEKIKTGKKVTTLKVCYDKVDQANLSCGGISYPGQNVKCCKGLVKRCGVEFFNGSCDMVGRFSIYSVPICLPCGNGICNQFEDRCNCPEDCG